MKKRLIVSFIILSMMASLSVTALADPGEPAATTNETEFAGYNDLTAEWYRASAEKYGYPEIFSDNGHFHPNQPITRMEFARMLHKALDIEMNYFAPIDIGEYYSDVDNEEAGASELYDLVTTGIVDASDSFGPEQPLSREIMIHYLMNALRYVTDGNYYVVMMMPAPFDDDASINEAYKNDVIEGRGSNRLNPKDSATRAEAVVLADRLVELEADLVPEVKVTPAAVEDNGVLRMRLVIENTGDAAVTINHSSGQKYDFKVLNDDGETLYTWSADKNFIAAMTGTEIEAGGKAEFSEELDSEAYGRIREEAAFVVAYIVGSSNDFSIEPDGYTAEIL
jgi:hypothetical protein